MVYRDKAQQMEYNLRMVIQRRLGGLATWLCISAACFIGCDKPSELLVEHLRRGDAALAEGQYAQALAAYGHAHELAPHDTRVQKAQMRARVYLMAENPTRVGADALEDVAYEARWLLDTDPSLTGLALTALANGLVRRGDIEGAKSKLAEAIKTTTHSYLAHIALGNLSLNEPGGLGTAKVEFELALQQKPDAVGALIGLGQIKLAEGDLAGAIDKWEAATKRTDDVGARLALGTARLRQGKHADAARDLRRVLLVDPRNADALSGLGQALLALGQLEEAEATLRSAMQIREDQPTAIALGFALTRLERPEQALSIFHKVLVTNAHVAPALYGSGLANERLGRTTEALANYQHVLSLPVDGPQKDVVAELQKEALLRLKALAIVPSSSASAGPAPVPVPPPNPAQPSREPLSGRQ